MEDLFEKQYALLLTNVMVEGKTADIFIDETGLIADISENLRKTHAGAAEFIIDGDGAIALPGLVNTHTHAAMSLLRGYADDMILQDWLSQKIWPLEAHLTPCRCVLGHETCLPRDDQDRDGRLQRHVLHDGRGGPCGGRGGDPGNALLRVHRPREPGETGGRVQGNREPRPPHPLAGQSPDPGRGRAARDLHGLPRRSPLVRGICRRGEDRHPYPPVRDGKGGNRLHCHAREAPGSPSRRVRAPHPTDGCRPLLLAG